MNQFYYYIFTIIAPALFIIISLIGIRLISYWWSFIFYWRRYRILKAVTTNDLRKLKLPHLKIQITTRGSEGSTEVILRGIKNVLQLVKDDPIFYRDILSVEVITESLAQGAIIKKAFASSDINIDALVLPQNYQTENGTQLKARGLHYVVERRRDGWNKTNRKTFIVHYDEESVMTPGELRKLFARLSQTDKKILEGPIYYPLEYMQASPLCRAMEANRPIGCYECRHVMESGLPLHLHGSNLIIDEDIENEIGWDIGSLDGQAFIAEDYVFGMNAFVKYGKDIFGWHGCVMLEQPPFSIKSAFKQRYRWIFGVLQGMTMVKRIPSFSTLPYKIRLNIIWGTRYRIATFALGSIVGILSLLVMPLFTVRAINYLSNYSTQLLSELANIWLGTVGMMWLGSIFIGTWYNVIYAGLDRWTMIGEVAKNVLVAPAAGIIESSAAFWAVIQWSAGKRTVTWVPTPKTKASDIAVNAGVQTA